LKRFWAYLFLSILLIVIGIAIYIAISSRGQATAAIIPTPIALPTSTDTAFPTSTPSPTITPLPTETETLTNTATVTTSATSTSSPTLSTRVFQVTVINPGITLVANQGRVAPNTLTPLPTVNVPKPPPIADLALASTFTGPEGWVRYEDDDPAIEWQGQWHVVDDKTTFRASARHYKYAEDPKATAYLRFLGAGVRVRYVGAVNGGVFEVRLDGRLMRTVDSYYSPKLDKLGAFLTTEVWATHNGFHELQIVNTDRKNFESTGAVTGIDAIEVYRAGIIPTEVPVFTATPTQTPAAASFELIMAPPTIVPTAVELPPANVSVELLIAYDQNGNKVADPNEGVRGISVRLMETGTNRIVASGLTDPSGVVRLAAITNTSLRLISPYLGKYWDVPARSGVQRIVLLIPPVNQPGLIP